MLFSFFHNFVKLKLVILFSRLISFFPIFNRVTEKLQKVTYRSHTNPPQPLIRTTVRCPLTRERERGGAHRGWGLRGGMGVRRGLEGTLRGGGTLEVGGGGGGTWGEVRCGEGGGGGG